MFEIRIHGQSPIVYPKAMLKDYLRVCHFTLKWFFQSWPGSDWPGHGVHQIHYHIINKDSGIAVGTMIRTTKE